MLKKTIQRHLINAVSTPPMPDRAAMRSFYDSSDELVHRQLAAALAPALRDAMTQVTSAEGRSWSW